MAQWLIRRLDGAILSGGPMDVQVPDQTSYAVIETPNDVSLDRRLMRWDGAAGVRAATTQEIIAYDAALKDAEASDIDSDLLIQAVAQLDFEERQKLQVKAGQTLLTAAQCKARAKAIYRSLLG